MAVNVNFRDLPVVLQGDKTGTLAVNDAIYFRVPKMRAKEFAISLAGLGGTTGGTTVKLYQGTTELASITIAYNASSNYASATTFATDLADGWAYVKVTAIPGAASSGLHFQVFGVGLPA